MSLNRPPVAKSLFRHFKSLVSSLLLLFALSVAAMAHAGSVYVPVDSWVYPAAERLAVVTDTSTEVLGMRPWTRAQFARFLESAREREHNEEAAKLQDAMEREFAPELNAEVENMKVESAYMRSTQIAGTPLRDSLHFGQTFANDFGRPYGQGFNAISGASGYAQDRAVLLYVRGEYQRGASIQTPSGATLEELATLDFHGLSTDTSKVLTQGGPAVNNPRLLDTYVGVSFGHFTGTLGKQSLWWGPAAGAAMSYSNNIEPIWMGRLTNDTPFKLPILGKMRVDLFYGKLQEHRYMPGPWIHGEKISIEPLNGLEIGFSRTVVFLGEGRPFSFNRLWRSYISVGDSQNLSNTAANDPGDRRGGLDFSWKLPKYPVTLYSDGFTDDDPSPVAAPTRAAFHPGLYIAQFPGMLAKLDLRVEGAYTASENKTVPEGTNYWNGVYRDGYTNKGLMIGDTVGRAGVSWQAWSSYWLSPRNKVQVSYLNHYISPKFLPGGGTQNSFRTTSTMLLKRDLELELGVQAERVLIPLLTGSNAPQYDVSGWFGMKFSPAHKVQN